MNAMDIFSLILDGITGSGLISAIIGYLVIRFKTKAQELEEKKLLAKKEKEEDKWDEEKFDLEMQIADAKAILSTLSCEKMTLNCKLQVLPEENVTEANKMLKRVIEIDVEVAKQRESLAALYKRLKKLYKGEK